MARSTDDDILEPILPKHPPVAGEPSSPPEDAVATAPVASGAGPPWHRTVLVACAVVATLALVFCAVQLSSIAEDQRLQACQVRVYAEETIVAEGDPARRGGATLRQRFADCLGVDVAPDDDDRAPSRTGDD